MDAGDLSVFMAVARSGGITRAAQALNTVQSNVTQRIRQLEHELGVPLFHRHSRGVTLTSAGRQLLPYAERIAGLIGEARQATTEGKEPRGRIVVGALESATAVRLPPILARYAAAHPQVDIEVQTGTTAELTKAVIERRLEAAFVAGPVDHPELVAERLIDEELVAVTAPTIGDLAQLTERPGAERLKLIVFRPGCSYRTRLEALLAAHGLVDVRRLEFGTLDGIIGCVGAGMGVTLLPRSVVAQAAAEGRVKLHAIDADTARVPTMLIRRRDAFVSTALERFFAIARSALAPTAARAPAPTPAPTKGAVRRRRLALAREA